MAPESPDAPREDLRIVALVPRKPDAEHVTRVLGLAGLDVDTVADMPGLCHELQRGAGALLLVQEALDRPAMEALQAALATQPPWSDVPVLLFCSLSDDSTSAMQKLASLRALGNVTLLERPVHVAAMLNAAATALQVRKRQYVARDHVARIEAADAALQNSQKELQRLADAIPHIVWATQADGTPVYFNRRWYDETGLDHAASVAQGWLQVVHPDDRAAAEAWWRKTLAERDRQTLECRLRAADGSSRWHIVLAEPLQDGGRVQRWVCSATDVHEARTSQEQRRESQKMEAIGRLAGGVAHEFNNMLTVIHGFAELTTETLGPEHEVAEYLHEVTSACEKAAGVTRQLLAYGRRQVLSVKRFPLQSAVQDAWRLLQRLLGERIELVTDADPQPLWVEMDPAQLQQVVLNLVVNARDAMADGGRIVLTAGTTEVDATGLACHAPSVMPDAVPPGRYACLSVRDEGTGIPSDALARVFEPFFTTKGLGMGTGLGLPTAYGIVRQSDGYMVACSEPGKGATFSVLLPLLEAPAVTAEEPLATADAMDRQEHGKYTILLAEDEAAVRTLACRVLEHAGFAVLAATDGEEALRVAARYPAAIDLLLTDVVMPRMTGPELAEKLRRNRPDIKVAFVSGYPGDDLKRMGPLAEGDGFLQKPFSARGLVGFLRGILVD